MAQDPQERFWEQEFQLHNKERPDQSFYLCHFTKNRPPVSSYTRSDYPDTNVETAAFQRFASILQTGQIHACRLPHFGSLDIRAVCFTEMVDSSLNDHAINYSPWGLAFRKSFLFNRCDANPVLYCRDKLWQSFLAARHGEDTLRYLTPLRPAYTQNNANGTPLDYSNEREWRTPGPVRFRLQDVVRVFVPSVQLFHSLLPELYDQITRKNIQVQVIDVWRQRLPRSITHVKGKGKGKGKGGNDDEVPRSCVNKYQCREKLNCEYGHTEDEAMYFLFLQERAHTAVWHREEMERAPMSFAAGADWRSR